MGELHHFYQPIHEIVNRLATGTSAAKQTGRVILAGYGCSDTYRLFRRATEAELPTVISPMYAPSLTIACLDLRRIVDVGELPDVRPTDIDLQRMPSSNPSRWFVGDRFLLPDEDSLVFVGRDEIGEQILATTPENVFYATLASIERGTLDATVVA